MTIRQAAIGPDTIVVRNPDMPATCVDEELVILNVETGRYVGLDSIGRRIWDAIEMPTRVGDLCTSLAREFRGDAAAVEEDTTAFLHELAREALIGIQA
ncbi:PqqD family protein [Flavisphingomonas formosensis]|uniref:PqqD family protein n=1 Tax=Flavisphingomonas formosensis TaxID=861534 RepID=UPI0012FB517D|nr:PqqD family protein [Sphingomonas formosensis]